MEQESNESGASHNSKAEDLKATSVEQGLAEIERIVGELEAGNLNLDVALEKFERGANLVKHCRDRLTAAAERIKILTDSVDGAHQLKNASEQNGTIFPTDD